MSPTYAWWIYNRDHDLHGMVEEPTPTAVIQRISRRSTVPRVNWRFEEHGLTGLDRNGNIRVRVAEAFPPKPRRKRKAKT